MPQQDEGLKNHRAWDEFGYQYYVRLKQLLENPPSPYVVERSAMYRNDGVHETHHTNMQCIFAAKMLALHGPRKKKILDIGSYRQFVTGLLANVDYEITVADIRRLVEPRLSNEERWVGDVKGLDLPDGIYDTVVTLCGLEHFGLGRYGDEFDLKADGKAVAQMIRVLKPGGFLVFTTTLTEDGQPCIWFNELRVYTHDILCGFLSHDMVCVEEALLSVVGHEFGPLGAVATKDGAGYRIYCGCWRKK